MRPNAFQIDSVNVLVRAHYMSAFAGSVRIRWTRTEELRLLQTWLKLVAIETQSRGDLAKALVEVCTRSHV